MGWVGNWLEEVCKPISLSGRGDVLRADIGGWLAVFELLATSTCTYPWKMSPDVFQKA